MYHGITSDQIEIAFFLFDLCVCFYFFQKPIFIYFYSRHVEIYFHGMFVCVRMWETEWT